MRNSLAAIFASLFAWSLLFLSALLLTGCGGGAPAASKQTGKGRVAFVIHWPPKTKSTRLIPVASNLIRIQISDQAGGAGTLYGSQDAVRPHADGSPDLTTPTTTVTFNNLPPGQFYATMTAYPGYQPSTTNPVLPAQATATTPLTIAAGQTTTTNLTMGSTITQVLDPALVGARKYSNRTVPFVFTVQPRDAAGNIVLVTNSLQVSVSDTALATVQARGSGTFAIDSQGKIGVTQITVEETESQVSQTFTVSFDPFIYIADRNNLRIVRVDDSTGENPVTFGSYGSGVGQFSSPNGVAVDGQGRVYVADGYSNDLSVENNRIVRINDITQPANAPGNWQVLPAFLGTGVGSLQNPYNVSLDQQGRIYIADTSNSRIVRVDDMNGSNPGFFAGFGGNQSFHDPISIAFDKQGRIYIADYVNSRIARVDNLNGDNFTSFPAVPGSGVFNLTYGVALDSQGRIYIPDFHNARVARVNDMGGSGLVFFPTGASTGTFATPACITLDALDRIYITDYSSGKVTRMDDITGTNLIQFDAAGAGGLRAPFGIAVY